MTKQTTETPKVIKLTDEWGDPLIDGDGNLLVPKEIKVGATIKFDTFRNDGTRVTSTRFITGGNSTRLTIKDYTGKPDGTLNVIQCNRECFTCWEETDDELHSEENCTGAVTFDGLEYINGQDMNFGQALNITVTNP
jgi:hypothetical protein